MRAARGGDASMSQSAIRRSVRLWKYQMLSTASTSMIIFTRKKMF